MDSELKYLLKGKHWEYNILPDNKLICHNKGLYYIFENKNDLFFQDVLSSLNNRGKPTPSLNIYYEKPFVPIPLELFHRVLRSNEIIYEQRVGLKTGEEGLYCFSDVTKNFMINHHEYADESEVYIDPQRMCKITRRIRDRERVHAKLAIEEDRIILECEFPWTVLTIILPTIQK